MGESSEKPSRILVVDDHQDFRSFMEATLKSAGYEVCTAAEGEAALALQRGRPADLLITDIFMPGKEGFETITHFREEFPATKIIVMSAGILPGLQHDFLASAGLLRVGATLRKPFTAEQLLATVREVLQAR